MARARQAKVYAISPPDALYLKSLSMIAVRTLFGRYYRLQY